MTRLFIYGTLCHAPLLHLVLGRVPEAHPAVLRGHAVYWAVGHDFPLIVPEPGGEAVGTLLSGLTTEDLARLDCYEGPFGYGTQRRMVETAQGEVQALVYLPTPGQWQPGAPWSLTDWVARWGPTVVATAADVMAQYPAELPLSRRYPMLVRGASRVRAALPAVAGVRRSVQPADITVKSRRQPYADFFAVEEYDLSFRRFEGSKSPVVTRAAFVSGDAVTVLPYDPVRDRVLFIEQFRVGPFARGDVQPWQLEPIAGRIDPGETPEQAARREAVEEAGLYLTGDFLPVANYYPTPGAKTEFLYSYIALTDLPDGSAGLGGEQSEAEDIKGHLMSFEAFAELIGRGEVTTAPLLLSYYWLASERPRLRAVAAVGFAPQP
ncbi:gamma-glutamylcyclotransferase [Pseudorhodobacter sp.]|uniref:gamma-glutamylcyclotransferase n=1 Tax=Pseudorhodobacter sp. TaxID=1934400 RepID=UPI002648F18B|nr:gamma-glutamylcyclotransferase [Pseudorhodobacter sp.]MDN5787215.1 gamma-glutamylcyclotransferase [Pseudorhodobacter sp.]